MPDVRWPREWESDRDPITGEYWAFSPTILARDVKEVPVYVPLRPNGTPDLDGLLACLRLDPAEVEGLLAQIDVARRLVDQIDAMDRDFDIAPDPEFDDYAAAWDQLREIAREFKRLRGVDRA